VWFNLTHVCKKWRAIMFASSYRLDLNITVGPEKPEHIRTILSGHLPILIDYLCMYGLDVTGSALWRMRAALRERDRVREISFEGKNESFEKFIKATNYHFPVLESLVLRFGNGYEPDIPATFLRGPELSDLPLRRLCLHRVSLASVSGLLLSATALTDLTLQVYNAFNPSQGSLLLACLQGMHCLRCLNLNTPYFPVASESPLQHPTAKNIVPLSKLTRFHYIGHTIFLANFMSGLSAPSLQDAHFELGMRFPLLHLPRFIDDVTEQFRSVSVTFHGENFCLSSVTHLGNMDRFKSSFGLTVNRFPDSVMSINGSPSTKLSTAEELALYFPYSNITRSKHVFSLREFLRQFRSVKVLRLDPFIQEVALSLREDDGEAFLPVLEQIELSASQSTRVPHEEHQRRAAAELAAFEPFVSAREEAGRPVKVFHRDFYAIHLK
jgi:hypothetical protein